MSFSTAIFDLDGTILTSEKNAGTPIRPQACKKFNLVWDEEFHHQNHGLTNHDYFGALTKKQWKIVDIDEICDRINNEHIIQRIPHKILYPGAEALLKELQSQQINLSVYTNQSRTINDALFAHLPFKHYFDHVLTADDVAFPKPAPDGYLLSVHQHRIDKSEAIILEDSLTGLEAGISSWIATVWITHNITAQEMPKWLYAIVDNYFDFLKIITGE